MLILVVLSAALTNAAFYEDHFEEVQRNMEMLHAKNDEHSWKIGLNPCFAGKSFEEIKMLMGDSGVAIPEKKKALSGEEFSLMNASIRLPVAFDSRVNWPKCTKLISHIKDQSNCGSCWAVSSASAMSDRTCIASKGRIQVMLSDEELLSCCKHCGYGCNGGYVGEAFKYWVRSGVPSGGPYGDTSTCKPYTIRPCQRNTPCAPVKTPKCTNSCIDQYNGTLSSDRHFGRTRFDLWFGEHSMMQNIYKYGPLVASFTVYSDFVYYKSGVYEHKTGVQMGRHAVRIIGWGVENGKSYWLIANSWSTKFGEDGLFKIRRGVYECGIEQYASAGYARV